MVATKLQTATLDSKGRLLIPEATRKELGFAPGDVVFFKPDAETGTLYLAKAINPFDGLALAAIAEDEADLTLTPEEAWAMVDQEIE